MADPNDPAGLPARRLDCPILTINTSAIRADDRCCIDSKPRSSVNERGMGKECESSLALPGVSQYAGGDSTMVDPTAGWHVPPLGCKSTDRAPSVPCRPCVKNQQVVVEREVEISELFRSEPVNRGEIILRASRSGGVGRSVRKENNVLASG